MTIPHNDDDGRRQLASRRPPPYTRAPDRGDWVNATIVLAGALLWFAGGYLVYGRLMARVVGVDPTRTTPAHAMEDGVDFVPAKSWLVLFGHHFSSICGAGPIVGPALAVAYWGWGPSIAWVLVGSVFMGAVADFTSLVVSVRSEGRSIPEIARPEISPRARLWFSVFIWIALVLVIAVFAIFAARTFIQEPDTVVPSFALIPIAVLVGHLLYRTTLSNTWVTLLGIGLLGLALVIGVEVPIELGSIAGLDAEQVWIVVLLAYCFVASVTPVQVLLQPRDYLAGYLLFAAIGVGVVSIFITAPTMQPVALHAFMPSTQAGPLWPMLFVTIACGAISGFHSLVSSGTTCKQIASEAHACRIGYGGMLTEGLVGVLVVIAVGAALTAPQLTQALAAGGPIDAFSTGFGVLSGPLLGTYGKAFAVMALNAFILTTLDSATRIGRYLTQELLVSEAMYLSTSVVVVASGALALTGQWTKLWPAFGTSNQLIGALALLVTSCWLVRRGRRAAPTLVPAVIMLITTIAAFVYQLQATLRRAEPDWFVASVIVLLIVLALVVFWDGVRILRSLTAARAQAGSTAT
jgi:carbon starvation protein